MSKPTLLQTLLNRPSQTYSLPSQKKYFSSKQEMLRIAAETRSPGATSDSSHPMAQLPQPVSTTKPSDILAADIPRPRRSSSNSQQQRPLAIYQTEQPSDSDSEPEVFYTPNESPRASMASSVVFPGAVPRQPSRRSLRLIVNDDPLSSTSITTSIAGPSTPASSSAAVTPVTSHREISTREPSSPLRGVENKEQRTAITSFSNSSLSTMSLDGYSVISDLTSDSPEPPSRETATSTRIPYSTASHLRTSGPIAQVSEQRNAITSFSTTSHSSMSLDSYSIFSDLMSDSTRVTTPMTSDIGLGNKEDTVAITPIKPRKNPPSKNYVYTDEDWAKEVRWLVPPDKQDTAKATVTRNSSKKKKHQIHLGHGFPSKGSNEATPPAETKQKPNYFIATNGTPVPPQSRVHSPSSSSSFGTQRNMQMQIQMPVSKTTPSIMMSMTALLEEDEDGPMTPRMEPGAARAMESVSRSGVSTRPSKEFRYASGSHPERRSSYFSSATTDDVGESSRRSSSSRDSRSRNISSPHQGQTRRTTDVKPPLKNRRSRSLGHEMGRPFDYAAEASANPQMGSGELASHGTPGYSTLFQAYAPGGTAAMGSHMKLDGKVDLTRSGVAQTTMASVEVVRGLGATRKGLWKLLGRRRTVSGGDAVSARTRSKSEDAVGFVGSSSALGFTSYRKPPGYVPGGCVLVQVWGVGVDAVDGKLVGVTLGSSSATNAEEDLEDEDGQEEQVAPPRSGLGRSASLRSRLSISRSKRDVQRSASVKANASPVPFAPAQADVGYIPGRSFVGRVLECGWEVREQVVRKGEWVVGLLDVRKCGALTEFIVVDRRRIHRVPHPRADTPSPASSQMIRSPPQPSLSLEELALLPLCGVSAYRAVRTFMFAFSSLRDGNLSPGGKRPGFDFGSGSTVTSGSNLGTRGHASADHENGRLRRAFVLRGHNGAGAMAVQMLVLRGWRVSVHVPFPPLLSEEAGERYMAHMEERVRTLGGEEVIFDDGGTDSGDDGRAAAVRVIDGLRIDGDVFDAVLDTIGGKAIREASERLLRSCGGADGQSSPGKSQKKGMGHFTTLVGDAPERTIPTAGDNFRAGLRSLKFGDGSAGTDREEGKGGKVGYAWVSVAQDVDWEGEDVGESIGAVLKLALEDGVRPWTATGREEDNEDWTKKNVVPFERTPNVFVDEGPLGYGGTVVIKIVG